MLINLIAFQRTRSLEQPSIDEQLQMKRVIKGADFELQQQHTQLMDEFRKAHRKMFKANENGEDSSAVVESENGSQEVSNVIY